jgi:hypothetical protein
VSAEESLARLERQVLGITRVSSFVDAVDRLRRMLAAESPGVREAVLKLVAPAIGRDLAAAVGAAWNLGVLDAERMVGQGSAKRVPGVPPKALVLQAAAVERALQAELTKARKLARVGADETTVMAPVNAARNHVERAVASLINAAGNAGTTAVADAAGVPTVWVAEFNACVTCLRYSGEVAKPGKSFPAGLTYGARSSVAAPVAHPPAHPHCRCTVEPLNATEYADALRREADRSVLRGFSLESESMGTRVDAARRLVESDPDAPKSVIAYARRAVAAGEFPTRGRP